MAKRFINTLSDDEKCSIIERGLGIVLPRKPVPLHGYQKRTDILTRYYDVSNRIPSPQGFPPQHVERLKRGPIYNRMGAVVPPVPVRKRVPDDKIVTGTPCASHIKDVKNINAKHNVFYDMRTGEVILVVLAGSEADRFYTRYYEGKASFPHIGKMNGEKMRDIVRQDVPPIMLVVDGEPIYWGYSHDLEAKMKYDPTFSPRITESKSCWLQLQEPMILEPRTRPAFDVPRLRFVQSMDSTIKRVS